MLRNNTEGGKAWDVKENMTAGSAVGGRDKVEARFMEVDGGLAEIGGDFSRIRILEKKNQEGGIIENSNLNVNVDILEGKDFEKETILFDPKRRRMDNGDKMMKNISDNTTELEINTTTGLELNNGPKNGREAGPVNQARLRKEVSWPGSVVGWATHGQSNF